VEYGLPDFMTDFCVVPADRFDIFLVQDDTVRPGAKVEHTFLRGRHTLKNSHQQAMGLVGADFPSKPPRFRAHSWSILNDYREIMDPLSEFHRKRVQHFLHQPNEVFPLHRALLLDSFQPRASQACAYS
jgi:hypothetical protein